MEKKSKAKAQKPVTTKDLEPKDVKGRAVDMFAKRGDIKGESRY